MGCFASVPDCYYTLMRRRDTGGLELSRVTTDSQFSPAKETLHYRVTVSERSRMWTLLTLKLKDKWRPGPIPGVQYLYPTSTSQAREIDHAAAFMCKTGDYWSHGVYI